MTATTTASTAAFDLQPGTALALGHAAGRELVVFSGRLWLTCSNGSGDIFLTAGERIRLGPDAVIESDSPSAARLQLLPAHGRLWWGAARVMSALGRLALRLQGVEPVARQGCERQRA
jgi:hypothetical protein